MRLYAHKWSKIINIGDKEFVLEVENSKETSYLFEMRVKHGNSQVDKKIALPGEGDEDLKADAEKSARAYSGVADEPDIVADWTYTALS
ncbi:MAG TPA: hypothetical protein VG273_02355 [Bryobacteraceae bacterium]|jgi:hypothetical protein|nr:hypothetical protein [Bryobacteraceae bacterium]